MTLFQTLDAFSFLKPSVARKVVIEAGQMATLILHPQFPETQSRVTPPAGDHDAKEHSTISAIAIISAFQIASAQCTKFVISRSLAA